MKIDLSKLPVIDNHCHPFPAGREPAEYERNFCIGLYPVPAEDMRNTIYFQMVINELRSFYKMPEDSTVDEVIAKRNDLALNHRKEYAQQLFKDANIVGFLCDFGFPITRKRDPEKILKDFEIEEYYDHCGDIEIKAIDRIEWIANRLLEEQIPFDEFEKRLVEETKQMVKDKNLIAVKSVIAYYTGLQVNALSYQGFRDGYYAYFSDKNDWDAEKAVRDFTFVKACEICRDLDIPLQIHTGLGDTPDCHIVRCNPGLLTDAINDPRCKDTKLVLIHGGYPYLEELGMMVNHYKNVYADISSFIPFASIACEEKVKNLMELAPLNKIFFGTDGGIILESLWYGAINFKRVFAKILEELIDDGYITYEFAIQTAENILYKNVKRVYKF